MASSLPMARMIRTFCVVAFPSLFLFGCSPKEQDPIVARIGPDPVRLSEYERIYLKSGGPRDSAASASMEEREKFLDLIVRYKLKLKDATTQGLQFRPDVRQEIEQYKGSLAQSFLTERQIVTPGVRQLYQRRQEELRVEHILLELSPTASPAESIAAYRGAYEVIDSLKAGVDFHMLARRLSKDPSAKDNGGDLYYATGGDFVTPFEDAAYSVRPGQVVPQPVRSRFGLHIIRVVDRKPAEGEVNAAHIMVRFQSAAVTPEDSAAGMAKIMKIRDSLFAGFDFAELAKRNSEDGGSASKGGDLGWFSRRRWVRPFDDSVFVLKVGQVSSIVRSPYGFHLIKCLGRRPLKSFEESKQELDAMYQQRRFADDNAAFLARLKSEVGYARNDSILAAFVAATDTLVSPHDSAWGAIIPPSLGHAALLTLRTGPVSVDSVCSILRFRQDLSGSALKPSQLRTAVDKISEQLIFTAKADGLTAENPDFAAVMREYSDGVLLYQVEQEQVWAKIAPTDSLLREYFNANREKFMFPDRVRFTEMRTANEGIARSVRESMFAGVSPLQIAKDDSLRMKLPSIFAFAFKKGSAAFTSRIKSALDSIALQMSNDKALLLRLVVSPDTLKGAKNNRALAAKRGEEMKKYVAAKSGVAAERISVITTPFGVDSTLTPEKRTAKNSACTGSLIGRTPAIIAGPEVGIYAPSVDERAKRADSLTIGGISAPFFYRNGQSIVRLDGRESPRQKLYEEAGAEVSTSYQDFEAKRLENAWITSLKARFPVVEQKEVLKSAFAPAK